MGKKKPKAAHNRLETMCRNCNGTGDVSPFGHLEDCVKCSGTGYVPTDLGAKILDLVRHNLRSILLEKLER
jgi:DnaJ-class molecular chaperone